MRLKHTVPDPGAGNQHFSAMLHSHLLQHTPSPCKGDAVEKETLKICKSPAIHYTP